jgi:hypothetical protein
MDSGDLTRLPSCEIPFWNWLRGLQGPQWASNPTVVKRPATVEPVNIPLTTWRFRHCGKLRKLFSQEDLADWEQRHHMDKSKKQKKYSQLAVHSNPSLPLCKAAQQSWRAVSRTADTYRIVMARRVLRPWRLIPFKEIGTQMMEMNGIEMTEVQTSLCRQSLNRDSRWSILDSKVKLSRRDFLYTVDMTVPNVVECKK